MRLNHEDYAKLAASAGLHSRSETDLYNKFSRFGTALDPYSIVTSSREYIFFTKPDFHLFANGDPSTLNPELANDAFFNEMHDRYNNILCQLQISNKDNKSPFINLLTNTANSGLDIPSLDTLEMDTSANVYGEMIKYRWMALDSTYDFSIEFLDTKYLEVYHLCKIWEEYSRRKAIGMVTPPNDNYIINKILHDQVCGYKFIVGEDGETLLYYAKVYGVYEKNVPRDVFSNLNDKDGHISMSVSFNADFVEDMDPSILVDFNTLTAPYASGETIPLYDQDNNMVSGELVNMPFIEYIPKSNTTLSKYSYYKLKWR